MPRPLGAVYGVMVPPCLLGVQESQENPLSPPRAGFISSGDGAGFWQAGHGSIWRGRIHDDRTTEPGLP